MDKKDLKAIFVIFGHLFSQFQVLLISFSAILQKQKIQSWNDWNQEDGEL